MRARSLVLNSCLDVQMSMDTLRSDAAYIITLMTLTLNMVVWRIQPDADPARPNTDVLIPVLCPLLAELFPYVELFNISRRVMSLLSQSHAETQLRAPPDACGSPRAGEEHAPAQVLPEEY